MSIFPRAFYNSDPSFTPLFRLLDDFDNYTREVQGGNDDSQPERFRGLRQAIKTFNPKFDIRETEAAYELHGELPGIDRSNVHIEFTDPQTLVIRGRVERSYSSGTPSAGSIEGAQNSGAITEGGEHHTQPHKVTVEDEKAEEAGAVAKKESANNDNNDNNKKQQQQVSKQNKVKAPFEKIWLQERSIGEFSRTFSFPSRVDHDGVTAKLEHGILNLVVPKAKKHEARTITIN